MSGPTPRRPVTGTEPLRFDEHFRLRVLTEAFVDATAVHWERRARQLEAARPRRGDFNGQATPAQLVERHRQLTEAATACRARAGLGDVARLECTQALLDLATGAAA